MLWLLCANDQARAAEPGLGDGSYGRLAGDLTLSVGAGGGIHRSRGHFAADLRVRYLDAVGLLAAPGVTADAGWGVVTALELRPLFLARFLTNRFLGRAFWDLTLDSLGVELGTWLGPLDDDFGAALLVGLGLGVPLLGRAEGPWLRVTGRYVYGGAADRATPQRGRSDWQALASLVFRWTVSSGLVSWAPPRYETANFPAPRGIAL